MHVTKLLCLIISILELTAALALGQQDSASEQDRLRGSITPARSWWDVRHYRLELEVFPETKSLCGTNRICFHVLQPGQQMQIDLQPPLEITQITYGDKTLEFRRDGNVYWVQFELPLAAGVDHHIDVAYEGTPEESENPPWSGGLTWDRDDNGKHFIATTCQGAGASIWWPNKDHGYDEPDCGMDIIVTVPDDLIAVSNGRLRQTIAHTETGKQTFHWSVVNPINNYCVNVNIGDYVHFSDTWQGEFGQLDMDYWVLRGQRDHAIAQFREAPRTIAAFEHWFGKYPFYEDSFKLVSVPYLGMEHQSSVTYGNGFQNGYRGTDLSDTGVGLKFDFIIVHETGHEWFGNNISMKDIADMWIHESFTNYSENLFVEYHFTRREAEDYVIGCRRLVQNDRPIIGQYGVNQRGSGDMYYKGGNMLHTMRHVLNDDEKWRSILRGLNSTFWHQTVTSEQIESYISQQSGIDFGSVFDQYLRSTTIPILNYSIEGRRITFHYDEVVEDFDMPINVRINGKERRIVPRQAAQTIELDADVESFEVDRNFYVIARESGT